MIWYTFPHMPEAGAHILVKYKGCKDGNYFEMIVREVDTLGHIEKWCYFQDYKESMERKLKNLPNQEN